MADKNGKRQALTFKRTIDASPAEVYRALTKSTALRQWMCDAAQADARKGGRLFLWWNNGYQASGEFTAVEPEKKVAFTWHGQGDPEPTQVLIKLKPAAKNGGTTVSLEHAGVGKGKKWQAAAKEIEDGWQAGLENLQSVLETGEDLRIVRRPMIGISSFDEVNRELVERLRLPVTQGVRIGGVVDGMGAQAAGVQKDDVIVKIGDRKVTGFASLTSALQSQKAGDTVAVSIYRDGEKQTLPMKLSRRPLPDMPATAAELSQAARAIYDQVDADLAELFAGVSEQEAGFRPGPKEWSAKDILTHLITSERGQHDFVSAVITDSEPWYDDFENDVIVRPRGMLALYPTVQSLLDELKRAEAETVAILAALPDEVLQRKRAYWRLCINVLQPPTHPHTHFPQILAAVEAARSA